MTVTVEDIDQHEFLAIKQLRERLSDIKPSMAPDYFMNDLNLIRFIRARKSVDKAEIMFRKFIDWLEEVEFSKALSFTVRDEIVENFKWKVSGLDKFGGPVVVVPIGQWDPVRAHDATCDELVKLALRSLSKITGIAIKQCREKNISVQATGIADLKGLGMKHVTHVEGIKATLTMVRYFEANFPEYLRIVYVLNAPYVFSIAWRMIKPLITGTTHEKIKFVYSNFEKEISKFVDPDQLPISYGGTLPDDSELVCDGRQLYRVNSNGNHEDDHEISCIGGNNDTIVDLINPVKN